MNDDLIALIEQSLGGDFTRLASEFLGENQGVTQAALAVLLPAVFGGIARRGATPEGASSLLSLVYGADLDIDALEDLPALFSDGGAGAGEMMRAGGGTLVDELFGDEGRAVTSALVSASGVKSESATTLVAFIVPLSLTLLKKFARHNHLHADSLCAVLTEQASRLTQAFDLSASVAPGDPSRRVNAQRSQGRATGTHHRHHAHNGASHHKSDDRFAQARWMPLVIAAALVFMVWNLLTETPVETPLPEDLVAQEPESEPEDEAAMTLLPARIYFDSGSATMDADGENTIAVVAKMINRSGLPIAVTGYIEQSGDSARDEELTSHRVHAVVEALRDEGVLESAIAVEPPVVMEGGINENSDAEARRVVISLQ